MRADTVASSDPDSTCWLQGISLVGVAPASGAPDFLACSKEQKKGNTRPGAKKLAGQPEGWPATKNPVQLGFLLRIEPLTLSFLVVFGRLMFFFSSPFPDRCTKLVISYGR